MDAFNEMTAGKLEIPLMFPLVNVRRLMRFELRLHDPQTLLTDVWRINEFCTISENGTCLLCCARGAVALYTGQHQDPLRLGKLTGRG